jgi:hypothetical protein
MIELLQQHGGIFKLPVSAPSNGKPTKPPSHHHNMTSIAIATGVKMMKDDVNSIIAKNVISNKKVVPRIINAMAASSDAVRNVKENSKRSP